MPDLGRHEVHVDAALSAVSQALKVPELIAERVMPVVDVAKESDVYYEFGREEISDLEGRDKRGIGELSTRIRWKPKGTKPYVAEEFALSDFVPDRIVANADAPVRPRLRAAEKIVKSLRTQYEIRVAKLLTDDAVISSTVVALPWTDPAADIEGDVLAGKESLRAALGMDPNTIIIPRKVANSIVTFLKGSAEISLRERATLSKMPDSWLDMNVIVAEGIKNTAGEGLAEVLASIWPTDRVLLAWLNPSRPAIDDSSLGWTFRHTRLTSRTWREEARKGSVIESFWLQTEKIVTKEAGFLLKGVGV